MKLIKKYFLILLFSTLISFIILIFFKPILTAKNLIFPYSISKFDIILDYPVIWKYIKLLYCINLNITVFLTLNGFYNIISFKKFKFHKQPLKKDTDISSTLKLLVGINTITNQNIYISENGLYQNILITGTIGSR